MAMKVLLAVSMLLAPGFALGAGSATLRWEVKANTEIHAFNVYRADDRAGPYVRINSDLVLAREGNADGILRASFVDERAESGKTYFYYVDTVKASGAHERLTGTMSKKIP